LVDLGGLPAVAREIPRAFPGLTGECVAQAQWRRSTGVSVRGPSGQAAIEAGF